MVWLTCDSEKCWSTNGDERGIVSSSSAAVPSTDVPWSGSDSEDLSRLSELRRELQLQRGSCMVHMINHNDNNIYNLLRWIPHELR